LTGLKPTLTTICAVSVKNPRENGLDMFGMIAKIKQRRQCLGGEIVANGLISA
jgi:hypothetical protein